MSSQVHGRRELAFGNSSVYGGATQCGDANHVSHAKECRHRDGLRTEFAAVYVGVEFHDRSFWVPCFQAVHRWM